MAVRSRRLAIGRGNLSVGAVIFTCPPDRTAIVKEISLQSLVVTGSFMSLGINPAGVLGEQTIEYEAVWAAGTLIRRTQLFHVLEEGDDLVLSGPILGSWVVSGSLLLGDPA